MIIEEIIKTRYSHDIEAFEVLGFNYVYYGRGIWLLLNLVEQGR